MYPALRKVKSNGKTVVGEISSLKKTGVQFESSLEEDLIYILDFDSDVTTYHDQPVEIIYQDDKGKSHKYTPDFLVEYKNRSPVLFEVKYQQFLIKHANELKPKFEAARQFAAKRSWSFHVITEREIKTEYCESVQFLHQFQSYSIDLTIANNLLEALTTLDKSTPHHLISQVSSNPKVWPSLIAPLWTLIHKRQICCNLFEKLHMEIPIWINKSANFKELKFPYQS